MKYSLIAVLCFVLNFASAQDRLVIDKVVAKVGAETILLSDVESQYSYAASQQSIGQDPQEMRCQILEGLIGQKLIVHQAKLDSIIISDAEVEAQLDFRISSVLRQMNGDEEAFENYYDMTTDEMRENLREDMVSQILAERMQGQLMMEIDVTPQEVKEFFNSIPVDSLPYLNAEVEIAEIVVEPQVNEIERLKALQKILEIRKEIVDNGASFAELAKRESDDPGSGSQGGELGFAARGTYVPEFEAVAYQLEQDEICEPVETEFGFHIIQMQERRGNKIKLRHILIKPEIVDEDLELAVANLDSLKMKLDSSEITWEKAVKEYSLESAQSYNNGGRLQNPNTGKTIFQTSELPFEIYIAIEEMEIGEVSEPMEFQDPRGQTNYRIIQLQSRTKPHKVSLEEDYSKIQEYARENKKNTFFLDWVNEKLGETYIFVDKTYLDCDNVNRFLK